VNSENAVYSIETSNLGRRFGSKEAVCDLTMKVPEGGVFALIGPNGAGKTTTIKVLMNIIFPSAGKARVLKRDSAKLGPAEFRRIGYVSENQKLPGWMTVAEFLAYCRPMYPAWDENFSEKLLDLFCLPANRRIRNLSRGMQVQTALVSSLAYYPALLVLDEPFSGLDPVVREDLTRGVLELTGDRQWTIFISSQDIEEVERLADWVAFLDEGRLVFSESVSSLQTRFRHVEVVLSNDVAQPSDFPSGWIKLETVGRTVSFIDTSYGVDSELLVKERYPSYREVRFYPMSLREIFVSLARVRRVKDKEVTRK
jgi:ABC-2 type transport system ATP-binding protein